MRGNAPAARLFLSPSCASMVWRMSKHSDTPDQTKPQKSETALREEAVLAFWQERDIFQKTLAKESPEGEFVFYDGPPFATGLPHYGSLLSSIIKDVVPRYKTMQGYHVRRRWGWDCHGLPIENDVEKKLGLKTKKDIYDIGIDTFNEACRAGVLRYAEDWEKYVDRVGRWVDFKGAYKTMDNSFIESVWWGLSEMHKKGLLYEGRKVLLYCPRCETPIAKAEVAQDNSYKDVTEESVYVKFRVKSKEKNAKIDVPEHTYLLAWTTTPWTLPGNVALAVGEDITYVLVGVAEFGSGTLIRDAGEIASIPDANLTYLIVAKEQLEKVDPTAKVVSEFSGKDLIGLAYEPLYEVSRVNDANKPHTHTVLPADFVTTDEGTGIVHTAVIYGEDDYELGQRYDLPMVPLLAPNGHFNDDAPEIVRGQYFKKASKTVADDLETRTLMFKREQHTHSYPHCHRCDTPLIYNALTSWFINIQKVKKELLATNEDINWVPAHLKHGRYKHILENAPDWTISRNRFWASPLPIWKHPETGEVTLIGSLEELKRRTKTSGNRYFIMRHGESIFNTKNVINHIANDENGLSEAGMNQIQAATEALKEAGITHIYTSPLPRTRKTAERVVEALGLSPDAIVEDERLREVNFGEFEGKTIDEYHAHFANTLERFSKTPVGGENWHEVKVRMTACLYDIEHAHAHANVLIVSHAGPLRILLAGALGMSDEEAVALIESDPHGLHNAEVRELAFVPLPHNRDFELDLHRPYIDEVTVLADDGVELERIPEVIDCWVESGSMPFAEHHYPFGQKEDFEQAFPADFIAEYIAQTRTWFYYMHAVSVLLFGKPSFKNVVSTGTILATDGSKMSKSKGNYTDPFANFDLYGADALRFYLMSGPVMASEDLRFADIELREMHNRVVNLLWNTYKFYELFDQHAPHDVDPGESPHVLDRWIHARLNEFIFESTAGYEAYDMPKALRPVRDFVDDLSTWYVRRSRDRVKGDDETDRAYALATLRLVLLDTAKVIAPVMPFIADAIYRGAGGKKESVHLEEWPNALPVDDEILSGMREVRRIVSEALQIRAKHNIKVRQPLQKLSFGSDVPSMGSELFFLLQEEVNVKEISKTTETEKTPVTLDTTITPELQAEGDLRELIRYIQQLRKDADFSQTDQVIVTIATDESGKTLVETNIDSIKRSAGVGAIEYANVVGDPLVTETATFTVSVSPDA